MNIMKWVQNLDLFHDVSSEKFESTHFTIQPQEFWAEDIF